MSAGYEFRNKVRVSITNASSPYSVPATIDSISVDCSSGAVTVQLPSASANNGKRFAVKDAKLACSTYNITITNPGGTIDNNTSVVMAVNGMSLTFEADGGTNYEVI